MKVGAITVGQSPRVDIIPEIQAIVGSGVEIVERGALDGLSLKEVNDFYPTSSDSILVTRMQDGTEVKVNKKHIVTRLKNCILELEDEGIEISILLCTEDFPEIESKSLLLRPDRVLQSMAHAILSKGKIGVIVPSLDQIQTTKKKWNSTGISVVVETISPYSGTKEQVIEIASKYKDLRVDVTILDCIGFTRVVQTLFRNVTGKPVLLPRTLIGRIAREIVAGD